MRLMPLRFTLAVVVAGLCLACLVPLASAASFPCGPFLHQLHHGKLTDTIQGTETVQGQIDRWQRAIERDSRRSDLEEPYKTERIEHDKYAQALWLGQRHYLNALIGRIEEEDCDAFGFVPVVRWIRHVSGGVHADRLKLAGNGSLKAGRRVQYLTGGIAALDPAGNRIKAIAAKRGVTIPEPRAR